MPHSAWWAPCPLQPATCSNYCSCSVASLGIHRLPPRALCSAAMCKLHRQAVFAKLPHCGGVHAPNVGAPQHTPAYPPVSPRAPVNGGCWGASQGNGKDLPWVTPREDPGSNRLQKNTFPTHAVMRQATPREDPGSNRLQQYIHACCYASGDTSGGSQR